MKNRRISMIILCLTFGLSALAAPALGADQAAQTKPAPPPIGQNLVREGTFALKLAEALEIVATNDEIEAETKLGEAGIAPRNGWIADYPVTPDIIAELQKSVRSAAEANRLHFERDEALRRLDWVNQDLSLGITPSSTNENNSAKQTSPDNPPSQTIINNYYSEQGPPVVTYYTPPPDYYYLYSWVPSPFWSFGFWFPGFFILNDFHLTVHHRHGVHFISNHFNDVRRHRVFRIDPGARFSGRTYPGIGVHHPRGYISTGIHGSERRIFNGSRNWSPGTERRGAPPASSGGRPHYSAPSGHGHGVPHGGGNAPSSHRGGDGGRGGGGGHRGEMRGR